MQGESARQTALDIAESPEIQHAFETANYTGVLHEFRRHQHTLQGGFAVALRDDDAVASWNLPRPWPMLHKTLPDLKTLCSRRKNGSSRARNTCGHALRRAIQARS